MLHQPAPDFTLPAWTPAGRTELTLSAQRGSPLVLAFYPGDDQLVCTRQLCRYSEDLGLLSELGARLWGISVQDVASHERFATERSIRFPLLADTSRAVHRAYGTAGRFRRPRRAVLVLDADGVVAWEHSTALGLTYQDTATIAGVLRGLRDR